MSDGKDRNGAGLVDWQEMFGAVTEMVSKQASVLAEAANLPQAGADPSKLVEGWMSMLAPLTAAQGDEAPVKDRRFQAPEWDQPLFDAIRRTYLTLSANLEQAIEAFDPGDETSRARLRFAARSFTEAMSPANFPLTNPVALKKAAETGGKSLTKGLQHFVSDVAKGQMTHVDSGAFELGKNIATTPGKVVHQTPLYQLIQYAPATDKVLKTPLVIFPPWINRFYILDLTPQKSFIKWAVDQGVSVFVVSWKSADASMKDIIWDDYIKAQIDAIDTVRDLLDVPHVNAIGYCVAGTTLAATLALLAARGDAHKVKCATFFTAQVDFTRAGELKIFIDPTYMKLLDRLSAPGFLDGRVMAQTFNALRGNDLIWNYVAKNYLMGEDYPAFDLLHWNGDVTNLPARWHREYLADLYRDNKLAQPGAITVDNTPIDLTRVKTPVYIQAGREDHIAPAESVWKIMDHFKGRKRFVLAGSGHIAGVVNPPAANKYQYWRNDEAGSFEEFVAGAVEHKGSWWPDWIAWLREQDPAEVSAKGARVPGKGKLKAIEDAPGTYVKAR